MKNYNYNEKTVLLTGAGGPAPFGMIRVLRNWGYRVISIDMHPHSPAFFLSDKSYVVPAGSSKEFLPKLQEICEIEKIDAVISIVDEELPNVIKLENLGIKVIQPEQDFTNLCLDKYKCMNKLREVGLAAPETWLASEIPEDAVFPLFIKPRTGRGSRGIGKVENRQELTEFLVKSSYTAENLLCQSYLPGTEYTVSVVVWRDGEVQAVVPKEIISKVGVTKMAITRKNEKIHQLCSDIQKKIKANGPFNVQLKLDCLGNPIVFEINPRFSTSITLTMASGIDELGGLLSQALFGKESFKFNEWHDGVVMLRHTTDQFISEEEYKKQPISPL
jgi:carbamoyl-phosphate synthase large subunit